MDQYELIPQETQAWKPIFAHFLIPYCSMPGQHYPDIIETCQNQVFGRFEPLKWHFFILVSPPEPKGGNVSKFMDQVWRVKFFAHSQGDH